MTLGIDSKIDSRFSDLTATFSNQAESGGVSDDDDEALDFSAKSTISQNKSRAPAETEADVDVDELHAAIGGAEVDEDEQAEVAAPIWSISRAASAENEHAEAAAPMPIGGAEAEVNDHTEAAAPMTIGGAEAEVDGHAEAVVGGAEAEANVSGFPATTTSDAIASATANPAAEVDVPMSMPASTTAENDESVGQDGFAGSANPHTSYGTARVSTASNNNSSAGAGAGADSGDGCGLLELSSDHLDQFGFATPKKPANASGDYGFGDGNGDGDFDDTFAGFGDVIEVGGVKGLDL